MARSAPTRFGANGAWLACATIAHNLLRAAGTLTSRATGKSRAATLRHQIINVPARIAHRGHDIHLHTPSHPALGPAPLIGMTSTTQRTSRLLHTDQQAASDDQRHGVFDNSG